MLRTIVVRLGDILTDFAAWVLGITFDTHVINMAKCKDSMGKRSVAI